MLMTIALLMMAVLFAVGAHCSVAMGVPAIFLILMTEGIPGVTIAQNAFNSVDKYALVAVPFFLVAGDLMVRGKIADMIVGLIGSVVRVITGGLALTVMLSCVVFAAISGSSVACAAAVGASSVSALRSDGYPRHFAAGLAAVGGTLGVMIPPSLSFVVIGSVVGLPIDKLFIAGVLPGLMEALFLCIATYFIARRNGYGTVQRIDVAGFARQFPPAIPALLMPALILGTVYTGVFTPTEISAVAVAYAVLLCLLVYRSATIGQVWESIRIAVMQSAMIYMIIIGGTLCSFVLARMGVAAQFGKALSGLGLQPWQFLMLLNVILLILGTALDGIAMVVLTAPMVFPAAMALGISPIHLAVIYVCNVELATLTPPVGINIFVMAGIAKVPATEVVRGVTPFWAVRLFALMVITYVPWLSLVLVG